MIRQLFIVLFIGMVGICTCVDAMEQEEDMAHLQTDRGVLEGSLLIPDDSRFYSAVLNRSRQWADRSGRK